MVDAGGVKTFVREQGNGDPVLCVHGVPVSSFLYRKVLPALASRGLRAIAYDLPGLGLSDKPRSGFDYTWTGLGAHGSALVDVLGLQSFHLIVHDIGGPVGLEIAHAFPDRILSLTILNTILKVDGFRKPLAMKPFGIAYLGPAYLAGMKYFPPGFLAAFYKDGVSDWKKAPPSELLVHIALLRRTDGGRAFLKIMRSFETTSEKQERYHAVASNPKYPRQAIWGRRDPALTLKTHGAVAKQLVGSGNFFETKGKHFLQETEWETIAERVSAIAQEAAARRGT
jgi:haloalkane dehalogenase